MTGQSVGTGEVLAAACGLVVGLLLATLVLLGRLRAARATARDLRRQLDAAGGAQVTLAELRAHLSGLRHDIRGILSPAMLVADRLIGHQEPGVRRAGEVMVRTVERAAARLSETRLDHEQPNSAQL
jgi:CubicO group peptidase (beta-lactamase class C family)